MNEARDIDLVIRDEDDKQHKGKPHGWIQWKGTDACIDLYCSCGLHVHIDANFFYYFECECGRRYAVGQNVVLIPLTTEQAKEIEKVGHTFIRE